MEPVKVVIRYADGRVLKGYTSDFFPNKPLFHVGAAPGESNSEVRLDHLKAIFFVRDFAGNKEYNEAKFFAEGVRPQGRKAEVVFKDGEVLVGTTLGYDPARPGYFLSPVDEKSNNMRLFVVAAAVKKFTFL